MNNKSKSILSEFDYMNREEKRKKGKRSGYKLSAALPKKAKKGGHSKWKI